MKIPKIILVLAGCLSAATALAQGFVNQNFESGNTSGYSPGSGSIPASVAIPGWSAYYGGSTTPVSAIYLDGQSLGGAIVAIQDSNALAFGPIQGKYSVLLQGAQLSIPGIPTSVAIGQTATIPSGTQSLKGVSPALALTGIE